MCRCPLFVTSLSLVWVNAILYEEVPNKAINNLRVYRDASGQRRYLFYVVDWVYATSESLFNFSIVLSYASLSSPASLYFAFQSPTTIWSCKATSRKPALIPGPSLSGSSQLDLGICRQLDFSSSLVFSNPLFLQLPAAIFSISTRPTAASLDWFFHWSQGLSPYLRTAYLTTKLHSF